MKKSIRSSEGAAELSFLEGQLLQCHAATVTKLKRWFITSSLFFICALIAVFFEDFKSVKLFCIFSWLALFECCRTILAYRSMLKAFFEHMKQRYEDFNSAKYAPDWFI